MKRVIPKFIYYLLLLFFIAIAGMVLFSGTSVADYQFLIVESGSMSPTIPTGSIVMIRPEPAYQIGDVITFRGEHAGDTPITHRIYDIQVQTGHVQYETKGDANNAPDPRLIAENQIIGKVLFHVPYIGYLVSFAKKPLGFAIVVGVPAAVIIYDEVRNIIEELRLRKSKKAVPEIE